jgi:tRNA1Val (adenine37-N6)-methyltransferase
MSSNNSFQFKGFTIRQDLCAMKVSSDSVLLGAWVETSGARLLDIGTGTGLLAIMMAQRNPQATVDAIDADLHACLQAAENAAASPFAARINVIHRTLDEYCRAADSLRYDLIISNPPYFATALKGPDPKRNAARHDDSLPLHSLIREAAGLLAPAGRIALILPAQRETEVRGIALDNNLKTARIAHLIYKDGDAPRRILVELSADIAGKERKESITIVSQGCYTEEYMQLTGDFYLKFR